MNGYTKVFSEQFPNPCRSCGVGSYSPCVTDSGKPAKVHGARAEEYYLTSRGKSPLPFEGTENYLRAILGDDLRLTRVTDNPATLSFRTETGHKSLYKLIMGHSGIEMSIRTSVDSKEYNILNIVGRTVMTDIPELPGTFKRERKVVRKLGTRPEIIPLIIGNYAGYTETKRVGVLRGYA